MLTAWLAGFVMGFAGSVPVAGPINMLVFSFGLQGRLRPATLIALGGALPEAIWAGLAFWGFTALLERYAWIEAGSEIAATGVLVGVGLFLLLLARSAIIVALFVVFYPQLWLKFSKNGKLNNSNLYKSIPALIILHNSIFLGRCQSG